MLLPPRKHIVRFGVFEFDPASGDLWKAGRRIKLQNQPRQVLGALIARAGELVTRDELRRRLWQDDTFVDFDNGLNVAVRKIRDALGDVAPAPRYVETERAHGYRFIAPVTLEAYDPGQEIGSTDHLGRPSEAAGPLTRAPVAPEDQAPAGPLAPADHRAWLRRFSRHVFTALAVVVLAGAGAWLWTRNVTALPSGSRGDQDSYRRHTPSGAAYERYLMGRALLRATTEADAKASIAEFEAALALDPAYALASAGIATAAAQLRVRFASRDEYEFWDTRARDAAGRALQLDPSLAEAHVAIAAVHRFQEYDWDTVIRESRRALQLNASLDTPHLYLAAAYFHLGLLEEAHAEVRAARRLNPENRIEPLEILGAASLFAGRTNEAAAYLSQVHDLTDSRIVTYLLGWTLYYQGERQRAEMLLESLASEAGPLPGNARATLAAIRAARGATAAALALAADTAAEPELNHHAAYGLGTAYAQLGEPATAVRWLARAAATGFSCYPWYERDPLLDPIRTDERFAGFMRDLHGSWEDARARYSGRSR